MQKLVLIIADTDESFLKGLTGFIAEKYSDRFKVYSFNNRAQLEELLISGKERIDILLVAPDFYQDDFLSKEITLTGILSAGRLQSEYQNCSIINKYQLGDALVGNLLNLFSDKSDEVIINKGEKKTRVISVFSPAGGSGKTTIAYAGALKCAQGGKKVFYLNYEFNPSTSVFFKSDSTSNLTHVFYYIKAKNKNLSMKIDGIKLVDPYSGIHFFAPPERLIDMNDIGTEDFIQLIKAIRGLNFYDAVFVDLPSIIEDRTISIFKESDEVLFVVTPEITTYKRTQNVIRELEFIDSKDRSDVLSKFTLIMNKSSKETIADIENIKIGDKGISGRIPKISPLVSMQSGRAFLNMDSVFGEALEGITSRLM